MTKSAIFTYGRFNPPTIGHRFMIEKMLTRARNAGSKPFIVVTHSQNKNKNPLTVRDKVEILKIMFPEVNVMATNKSGPSPLAIVNRLKKLNFSDITMMVGNDRVGSFQKFVKIPIVSGGARNASASGISGVSATKARTAARTGNVATFRRLMNSTLSNKQKNNIMRKI